MTQLIIAAIAFSILPLMTGKCKIKIYLAILISSGIIQIFALHSFDVLWLSIGSVFSLPNISAIIAIILVGVLSGLMKSYGLLDDIIESAGLLIRNRKILMGTIPALIGLLSVPGGAFLSAPFTDELGQVMNIPKPRRVTLNLSYRHLSVLISPFSAFHLFIASRLPINTYLLVLLFVPFVILMAIGSSIVYMPGKYPLAPKQDISRKKTLFQLFKGLSPIILVLFLNSSFKIPMSIALLGSIILVWVLSDKNNFIQNAFKNVKFDVALMILAVYFAQYTISSLSDIQSIIEGAFKYGDTIIMMAVIMGGSLFLGFITGLYYVSLGVFLPVLLTVSNVSVAMPLLFFISVWAFLGYFYSPLHLCQLLTIRYIQVNQSSVYKEHLQLAPWLALSTIVLYFLYSLIF